MSVPQEWQIEQPDRFKTAVEGIQKRTQMLAEKYDKFIRQGREVLKV